MREKYWHILRLCRRLCLDEAERHRVAVLALAAVQRPHPLPLAVGAARDVSVRRLQRVLQRAVARVRDAALAPEIGVVHARREPLEPSPVAAQLAGQLT